MPTSRESSDTVEQAAILARNDGVFAGLTSGLAGALLGNKLMGFGRNKTIFCGIVTGVLSGYLFTRAFFSTHLATLQARKRTPQDSAPTSTPT